jgi:hypothetical protein
MEKVSNKVMLEFLMKEFVKHRENQIRVMTSEKLRKKDISVEFGDDGCPKISPQFGLETAITGMALYSKARDVFTSQFERVENRIEKEVTARVYKHATKFIDNWDWLCLLPADTLENKYAQNLFMWWYKDDIKRSVRNNSIVNYVMMALCAFTLPWILATGMCLFFATRQIFVVSYAKEQFVSELRDRMDVIPLVVRKVRDDNRKRLLYGCTFIFALYAVAKTYQAWSKMKSVQGNLEPKNAEDIKARDREENPWTSIVRTSLPKKDKGRTVTMSQMEHKIQRNLVYCSIEAKEGRMMSNALFICSNVLVFPNHYFLNDDQFYVTCYLQDPDKAGQRFKTILSKETSVHIEGTDLRLCYSPNGGSFKNLIEYFPTQRLPNFPFNMLYRHKNGEVSRYQGFAIPREVYNGIAKFEGSDYTIDGNTFKGMCGSVQIAQLRNLYIAGFHLGGRTNTPEGCAGTLFQSQIIESIQTLVEIPGVSVTGDCDGFTNEILGKKVITDEPLHVRSPVNFMPHGSQIKYHGGCIGRSTWKSEVVKSQISDVVLNVCGVPCKWGPPKMQPSWFGWSKCLEVLSTPALPFEPKLLIKAVVDFQDPLIALAHKEWSHMRPLTDHENLNGIPGCKFIDSIKLGTSIGYPLGGTKRKHVIEHEPTEEHPCNREFTPVILEEIQRCHDLYRAGKRAYTIAKACKKDEALPLSKEKCRIFYGNPIALTFLVRKYFLPITRFLQMNPLLSECAVGINCHSKEWDQMINHMRRFGKDRIFAGDYSKYDQRMPSQLIIAALDILINIAGVCAYSAQDLTTMRAMAGDIVYAYIAYDGDLISLNSGGHISGNSLTVVINGIVGALNLRCSYYTAYPKDEIGSYRKYVSIITYGDDNKGSVSSEKPGFNIKQTSEFLAKYGQLYTMPDKESELVEYMQDEDAEFLKRISVYHPVLGCELGALQDDSIYKSLHVYVRGENPDITESHLCAMNIDGALREWFNHGEEVFEDRRQKMINVAREAGITHMCQTLSDTYHDRCISWLNKYAQPGGAGC